MSDEGYELEYVNDAFRKNWIAPLGENVNEKYDRFDLAQLAEVIRVCRESDSMSDAAKKLFAVSRKAKSSSNDSDRLSKYLAKFSLKFKEIKAAK